MKKRAEFISLFLLCLSVLLLEISLTRLFSVTLWYHYAFLSLSITLLGMSIGGTVVYLLDNKITAANWQNLWVIFSSGASLTLFIATVIYLRINFVPNVSAGTFFALGAIVLLFTIPFFFAGSAISLLFKIRLRSINRYYAVDLAGAASGCLLCIPLLNYFGGETALLVISAILMLSAFVHSLSGASRTLRMVVGFLLLCLVGAIVYQLHSPFLVIHFVKGMRENDQKLFTKWNAYSRVAVFPFRQQKDAPFFDWGIDPFVARGAPEQLFMNIDAGAATPITRFDGRLESLEILRFGLPSLAYHLRDAPETLIIGPGGGIDLLRALLFGSHYIDAVEYNPIVYQAVNEIFGDFSGHLYSRPEVHFHLGEGRHFIHRSSRRYDVIQASLVDTFAASSAGALTLSESTLYTVEAFQDYFDHLKPEGLLTISRFIQVPPWETLRIASIALESLRRRGIKDPANCIAIVRMFEFSTTLVRLSPFSPEELRQIRELAQALNFTTVWIPGSADNMSEFQDLMTTDDPGAFYARFPLDVRPTTDDSPFFFFVGKLGKIVDPTAYSKENIFYFQAIFILVFLLLMTLGIMILFMLLPWMTHGRAATGARRASLIRPGLYFLGIGLGYMTVEVGLIQRFLLPLGHPVYSLSVVLFTMLVSSAAGSAVSGRARLSLRHLVGIFLTIVLLVSPFIIFREAINSLIIGRPAEIRIALCILLVAPLSFFMGIPFPRGLRHFFGEQDAGGSPWAWAVNGAASVLASIGALFLAMVTCYTVVLISGACWYTLAGLSILGKGGGNEPG
jgi:spermidine synthase